MKKEKIFKLRDRVVVFVDWANVYNWRKSLGREIDALSLYRYLKIYPEIKEIRFYFGKDKNIQSKKFLNKVTKIGFAVVTKPVKYIQIAKVESQRIYRRKCDFDMEICMDVHKFLKRNIESFIFFTGDGDFAPLYKFLIGLKKQVIVVYAKNHIGREVWEIKKGLFKIQIAHLGL